MILDVNSHDDWQRLLENAEALCEVNGTKAIELSSLREEIRYSSDSDDEELQTEFDAFDNNVFEFIEENPDSIMLHSTSGSNYNPRNAAWNASENGINFVICERL